MEVNGLGELSSVIAVLPVALLKDIFSTPTLGQL